MSDARTVKPGEAVTYSGRGISYEERVDERRKLIAWVKSQMYAEDTSDETAPVKVYRKAWNDAMRHFARHLEGT